MANEMMGLLGRKVGMTQMYDKDQNLFGVTVVDVSGNVVITTKSEDSADVSSCPLPDWYVGFAVSAEDEVSAAMGGNLRQSCLG